MCTAARNAGPSMSTDAICTCSHGLGVLRHADDCPVAIERRRPVALSAPSEPVQDQPRGWAMPEIPEDVTRLSALAGDLICERAEYDPRVWACRSTATGRVLALIRTGELLDRYAPWTEVVEPDGH